MPEYQYQAKQGPEKLIEGVIEAPSETAAIEKISQQGYVPVAIFLKEKSQTSHPVSALQLRRDPKKVFLFTNSLARLLKAGVGCLCWINKFVRQSLARKFLARRRSTEFRAHGRENNNRKLCTQTPLSPTKS